MQWRKYRKKKIEGKEVYLNKVGVLYYDADPSMTEAESGSFGTVVAGDRQGGQILRIIYGFLGTQKNAGLREDNCLGAQSCR